MSIEVVESGFFTTVQDLGRYGYQRYGVPVSGAMDRFALRAGNLLVGNEEGAAGLEMTFMGPRLRFLADCTIAITGANLGPMLNDQPVAMWESLPVLQGSVLSFQGPEDGIRAYLCVRGGIDAPPVLGSRSTFVRSKLGGFGGRALAPGDTLPVGESVGHPFVFAGRRLPAGRAPRYGNAHAVRAVMGPQDDAFTAEGIATFLSQGYSVTPRSDRMGCRLQGPRVAHKGGADIVSDGTPNGAVQVTGDGMPIVLLADCGTTGGYTKIATVISVDLPALGQAQPGDTVTFRAVSLEEAHAALREQQAVLDGLKE